MKTIFAIVYENTTKKLVIARVETYTSETDAISAQEHLLKFCENNGFNPNDFSAVELPYTRGQAFDIGKHIYNESLGQLEVSPDWVEPVQPTPAPVTPAEPAK